MSNKHALNNYKYLVIVHYPTSKSMTSRYTDKIPITFSEELTRTLSTHI